jgi:hypothetical protein
MPKDYSTSAAHIGGTMGEDLHLIARLICCALVLLAPACGTTVVAVRSKRVVTIGADSRMIGTDGSTLPLACKLGTVNDVVWGYARLTSSTQWGYSLAEIARDTMALPGSMSDRLRIFEARVTAAVLPILKAEKSGYQEWFAERREGVPAVQIVFGAFEGGTVNLYAREFIAHASRDESITLKVVRTDHKGDSSKAAWVSLGHPINTAHEVSSHPDLATEDFSRRIRLLIEVEAEEHPDDVGGPTSIVQLNARGVNWIDRGLCN